ncbi:MAG: type II toxin-antitoxin system RelE/ParE family toxin [Phycisphaeraceae bacterium]
MSYGLILKPSAQKQLRRLSKPLQSRIIDKLSEMQTAPRPAGAVKLTGASAAWRVRVGDYRIVYEIDDAAQRLVVTIIAHRREVYRGL